MVPESYLAEPAFANANRDHEERPQVYDAAAADLSWRRTLDFFREHL